MKSKYFALSAILVVGLAAILGVSACKQVQTGNESMPMTQTATSSAKPIEKQDTNYHVSVTVPNPPLKTRTEAYTLTVHELKVNKPLEHAPNVTVEMSMGNTSMKAPTTVSPGENPGEFEVKTEFTMAGNWTMRVKPTPSAETITLTIPVQ